MSEHTEDSNTIVIVVAKGKSGAITVIKTGTPESVESNPMPGKTHILTRNSNLL